MKISTSDVKKGTIIDVDGGLFKVVETAHTHTGRGGATDTFKVKEITTGKNKSLTYHAGATLQEADVQTMSATFLYQAGKDYSFMEDDTAQMHTLTHDQIEDIAPYLKENLSVFLMKHEGNILNVILPTTIEYTITTTTEGIKGNRAQSGTKPATLETGLEVQVPLHKSEGDTVTVNTETGEAK